MLWLALELPSLPLQIAERGGASRIPMVISEGPGQRPWVACANAAARDAGVREGQAVAAAKALAGDMKVAGRDPAAERETLERIAAWAGQFTPMVAIETQGIVMEVESSLRLFRGHARLTAAVRKGIREMGFHASLGLAPTPLAARLFARAESQGRAMRSCLSSQELRDRIADLPIFLLDWPEKTLAHLTDLGVLRLRDILELPAEGIARRFGPGIVLSLDRLLGRTADPREPFVPPPRFRARLELPAEVENIEALLFPLRRMLVEMEGFLRGRGCGVQHLELLLDQGRKARTTIALDFASPEREAEFILGIAREKLGRIELSSAAFAMSLRAEALLPFTPRSSTWLPGAQEQAIGRDRLLQRLAARLGKERVFGIALADDHRPEKAWEENRGQSLFLLPQNSGTVSNATVPNRTVPNRPTWLLNRPHRLIAADGGPSYQGSLTLRAGPERIEAGWWDGEEVRRDYYVATNPRGEAYWIYREHRDPSAWYLHGIFS
ncbi:MAG TPA: DNA polymerase Y family protein [Usitatibacter sp.]|nr:DNA polymerase Y family protein [Usitatibacter sp.]